MIVVTLPWVQETWFVLSEDRKMGHSDSWTVREGGRGAPGSAAVTGR